MKVIQKIRNDAVTVKDNETGTLCGGGMNPTDKVPNIVIKSNTLSGEETAHEGDTINYSQPNSKTRRGRVGVGVAQTLDTQVNQGVIVAQIGWGKNNEQQLEQSAGDYTNTLTGVQKDNMLLLNEIKYGTEIKRNTKDILSKLWEEIGEEAATKWGFRILDTFQQKEILQSALFRGCDNKEAEQSESRMDDRTLSFKKAQEGLLREMWQQKEFGCSSHRWGLAKQFFEEFTNTLQELSYKGTQGEKELFDLPITTLLQRILHETLSKMEEVRESENDKGEPIYTTNIRRLTEIEVEVLQGFYPDWTKMGNYDGVVKEISRTQRYKMCGNAVTCTIVELIGIKLLTTLND